MLHNCLVAQTYLKEPPFEIEGSIKCLSSQRNISDKANHLGNEVQRPPVSVQPGRGLKLNSFSEIIQCFVNSPQGGQNLQIQNMQSERAPHDQPYAASVFDILAPLYHNHSQSYCPGRLQSRSMCSAVELGVSEQGPLVFIQPRGS
jgi:hypothetical protein